MRFVFTKLFYALLAVALIPISLSWGRPMLAWVAVTYDLIIIAVALFDAWNSKLPKGVSIERHFGGRFAVGAETDVQIEVANHTPRDILLILKDEYPPQMQLFGNREARFEVEAQTSATFIYSLKPPKRGQFSFGRIAIRYQSRWRLAWGQASAGEPITVKVYPNMRRAREAELRALGTRSFVAARTPTTILSGWAQSCSSRARASSSSMASSRPSRFGSSNFCRCSYETRVAP